MLKQQDQIGGMVRFDRIMGELEGAQMQLTRDAYEGLLRDVAWLVEQRLVSLSPTKP